MRAIGSARAGEAFAHAPPACLVQEGKDANDVTFDLEFIDKEGNLSAVSQQWVTLVGIAAAMIVAIEIFKLVRARIVRETRS